MKLRHIGQIGALAILIICFAVSFSNVKRIRTDLPKATKRAQALNVDPILLKVVSGPFDGALANYLLLKASIFVGGKWDPIPEDWETVYTLFKQSLYLDPYFFTTGYYTQGLLSWRPYMQDKAVELLKYHAEHRYWDWEPMFYVGFDYFYYLKDYAAAAKYLELTTKRPDAPLIASSLAARLSQKAGHTLTAIGLLKTMHDNTKDDALRAQYAKRLDTHLAVYQLEQAVALFKKQYGRLPLQLSELVDSRILKVLPGNPLNTPFNYDPETGVIHFDEIR